MADDIALFATGSVSNIPHVDEKYLVELAKYSDSVTILSAYYVPEVLEAIAGACQGRVKIVLNGLDGRRLSKQVKELEELQNRLRIRSRSAKIKLAFAEGIFHTKLYVFGTGRDAVVWVGSANATKAGLNGRNEEVLIRMAPLPPSVLDYIESVWSRAIPIKRCRQKVNSLIAFFRTGMLYYKPYATLPMTLSPFRRLLESLPEAEKRKITPFRSEYAEEETGIGAFNLNRVFEEFLDSREQSKVPFRRYAVETCYGYWVASPFIKQVNKKLKNASEDKRQQLNAIRKRMKKNRNMIVQAYASYLKDVRMMLDHEEVKWQDYGSKELFEDTSAVEQRVDTLLAALGKPSLDRHCQAFIPSEVPEIWEDDIAYASFKGSFFEALAYASTKNCIGSARRILESLDLKHVTAEEIRITLVDALKEEDWYKSNFNHP